MRKHLAFGILVALATSACATVTAGADKRWPKLVVVTGKATVPATFSIAADLRPAKGLGIRLVAYGRPAWEAVAVGRVMGDDGHYTLSLPEDRLETAPAAFEAQALDPAARVLLASPVSLARGTERIERNLDPATTVVALAARRAGADRHVSAWDVDALAQLSEVQAAAERLAGRVPSQAQGAASAAGDFASFALVPASEPPELAAAIRTILQNLAAP